MKYWIMKTEPDTFSIDDLKNSPKKTTTWDGVRNYQARNFMRDEMKKGDQVLIYHSSCKEVGLAGHAVVSKEAYPDKTAQDPKSDYYDPKSTQENPRWIVVDIKWKQSFDRVIPLKELKEAKELKNNPLVRRGNRLSIIPTTEKEFNFMLGLI